MTDGEEFYAKTVLLRCRPMEKVPLTPVFPSFPAYQILSRDLLCCAGSLSLRDWTIRS